MEYLIISYLLIAVLIIGYIAVIVMRTRQVDRALQEESQTDSPLCLMGVLRL